MTGLKMMLGGIAKAGGTYVPFMASFAGRYLVGNALNKREYLAEYKNWVYACVQARSEEVGNIQLKLMNGEKEIKKSPLLDLLKKVNPTMTSHELFFATQAFKDLEGNAFWYLARDGKDRTGTIKEIYILRPDRVQLIPSRENPLEVEGYVFTQPDGQKIPFEPQEILHHKTFNPLGNHPFPHRGMGVVEAAAWAVDTDNESRRWNYQFFKNNARPDGVLTTPGDAAMAPEDYQRLQEEWNSKHQGSDNAHKVAILSGGMTWTEISRTQTDMDFLGQRTFSRDEILAIFRVPKSIIGITDDVNRANADAAIYVFALRTIKPLDQQLIDTLNEFLVPEFGESLELTFESPVAEDRKTSLDEYTAGLGSGVPWLTINEVRESEGMEPIDGGDILYMPFNIVPAADASQDVRNPDAPTDPNTPDASAEEDDKDDKEDPKKSGAIARKALKSFLKSREVKMRLPRPIRTGMTRALNKEQIDGYIGEYKARLHVSRAPLEKKVTKFFDKQKSEVMKNVREQLKGFTPSEFKHKSLFDFLFDEEAAQSASISLITPFLKDYIKASGTHASQLVGDNFDPDTEAIRDFVSSRAQFFAETINGTTRESLLESIKQGIDAGEGLQDIEQRVADVYGIATGSRTQMIARTEISAASNQGAKNAYVQAGVEQWQWQVVSPDDMDCIENNGEIRDIGSEFPSGAVEPPDPHPNCECTTVPVFSAE